MVRYANGRRLCGSWLGAVAEIRIYGGVLRLLQCISVGQNPGGCMCEGVVLPRNSPNIYTAALQILHFPSELAQLMRVVLMSAVSDIKRLTPNG